MRQVLINATAARASGALTILRDFMSFVYTQTDNETFFSLLTTTADVFESTEIVRVYEISPQNWFSRISWDRSGLQRWCENKGIIPDVVVSFQNTCSHFTGMYKNVKWLVYYHQPLPLIKYRWKWYRKSEIKLFLYAHFYGYFVNKWNNNAEYVVQLPYIKKMFCNKFQNITSEKVHIVRPNLPKINTNSVIAKHIEDNKKIFLFPATSLEYKNHKIIMDAIELLKKEEVELESKIQIIFTVSSESYLGTIVTANKLDTIIKCIGNISYEELLSYYKRCNGLLFPSKIETFGLPLVEAAMFGLPIIAADLSYAREVLDSYKGVEYVNADSALQWKEKIHKLMYSNLHYPMLMQSSENTWSDFMYILKSL